MLWANKLHVLVVSRRLLITARSLRLQLLIQLAVIAVTIITAVILMINSAIHAVPVIQSCLGRPWQCRTSREHEAQMARNMIPNHTCSDRPLST